MRYLFVLFTLLTLSTSAMADVLRGKVLDYEARIPIEAANINVRLKVPNSFTMEFNVTSDSAGVFIIPIQMISRVTLTFNAFGYNPATINMSGNSGSDTISIGDIALKPNEILMKEIVIDAKVPKFIVKGDTIVFNPEAFHIEGDDRIAELLSKLPGISIKDGEILWMGKSIHILINGRETVGSNLFLGQLPATAVMNVKKYKKNSLSSKLTGVKDEEGKDILDIGITPSFLDKWYGSVEGRAYLSQNYMIGADANYLSDSFPIILFARASDNEEYARNLLRQTSVKSDIPLRQQFGILSLTRNWENDDSKILRDNYFKLSSEPDHIDKRNTIRGIKETQLENGNRNEAISSTSTYNHSFMVPLTFNSVAMLKNNWVLSSRADVSFGKIYNMTEYKQKTSYITGGSVNSFGQIVNETDLWKQDGGNSFGLTGDVETTRIWGNGSIRVKGGFQIDGLKQEGESQTGHHYMYERTATDMDSQFSKDKKGSQRLWTGISVAHRIKEKLIALNLSYIHTTKLSNRSFDNYRSTSFYTTNKIGLTEYSLLSRDYHPEKYRDIANSQDYKNILFDEELNIRLNFTPGKAIITPGLKLTYQNERLDFQRGNIDTIARRHVLLPQPALEVTWKLSKFTELSGNFRYMVHEPDLKSLMPYVDSSDLLFITMGNPSLKSNHSIMAEIKYDIVIPSHSQTLFFKSSFSKDSGPVKPSLTYFPETSGYQMIERNAKGGSSFSFDANFGCAIGRYIDFNNLLNYTRDREYYFVPRLTGNELASCDYTLGNSVEDEISIKYDGERVKASVDSYLAYWHEHYASSAIQDMKLFDYNVDFTAKYKWKMLNLMLQGELFGSHGYMTKDMNRPRFILNGGISMKIWKQKATISLNVNDIFNMDSKYKKIITPMVREETWHNNMHHYIYASFSYRFDAKTSK